VSGYFGQKANRLLRLIHAFDLFTFAGRRGVTACQIGILLAGANFQLLPMRFVE